VSLQGVEAELQQVRDSSTHQKKRVVDMMTNLMKDLADIGSSIGSEFKVCGRAVVSGNCLELFGFCVGKVATSRLVASIMQCED